MSFAFSATSFNDSFSNPSSTDSSQSSGSNSNLMRVSMQHQDNGLDPDLSPPSYLPDASAQDLHTGVSGQRLDFDLQTPSIMQNGMSSEMHKKLEAFCNALGNEHGLKPAQYNDLHRLIYVCFPSF
jgi:hypothetical protein